MTPIELPPDWDRAAFASDPNPSFSDLLRKVDPTLLPKVEPGSMAAMALPHGTTILALRFADGVIVAGDRRATEGYTIADRRMEKVYPADDYSAVAIAGAAGPAIEMVRLLQTQLEHYEKLEGEKLSLEGKANSLAQLIRANLPMAMQGLVIVPLFGGYDLRRGEGRLFRYDAIGGRYEDTEFHATGSGGTHARGTLKKRWRADIPRDEAVRASVEALMDASEEDTATGGPDLERGIFPSIAIVTRDGYGQVDETELRAVTQSLFDERGRRS